MGNFGYKQFSERHRPHIHPPGSILFVTYRLAGSIPQPTVRMYKAKKQWLANEVERARAESLRGDGTELEAWLKRIEQFNRAWFVKFENILHGAKFGPMWMQDERVAAKVSESLSQLDGKAYRLDAYSIMSNHVHAVFQPFLSEDNLKKGKDLSGHPIFLSEFPSLARIMQLLKGKSARECNLVLSRTGQFWEHERFDHVIRKGKFDKTVRYVLNNPVKVGLVDHWSDWRWNYCREELRERFDDK
jgi:REP element-mobilizing transposase RayT